MRSWLACQLEINQTSLWLIAKRLENAFFRRINNYFEDEQVNFMVFISEDFLRIICIYGKILEFHKKTMEKLPKNDSLYWIFKVIGNITDQNGAPVLPQFSNQNA